MASETLTLKMRAVGNRRVEKDVDRVGESVLGVGVGAKKANKNVGLFSRGLELLGTRMGMIIILATVLTITLGPPLLIAITLLIGALVALGAVLMPVFLIGIGVVQRFKDTVGIAGSAASELRDVLDGLKSAWNTAISPAAAIVMRAISEALVMLIPVLQGLRGPLKIFATFLGDAIVNVAAGLRTLAPQFEQLLAAAGPLAQQLIQMIVPFADALLRIAQAGMPALKQILDWLQSFLFWLPGAVSWLDKMGQSAKAQQVMADVFRVVAAAANYLVDVIAALAVIAYELYIQNEDLIRSLGVGLLGALVLLRDAVEAVSQNMDTWGPIIVSVGAAVLTFYAGLKLLMIIYKINRLIYLAKGLYIGWRAGVLAMTAAQLGLNAALFANPIGLIILGLVALAAGLYVAYQKIGWFHDAVNAVWSFIKDHWPLILGILIGPIGLAVAFMIQHFDWVLKKIEWVIKKAKEAADAVKDVGKKVGPGGGGHGVRGNSLLEMMGVNLPWSADGGHVMRGGASVVGERGAEIVDLPTGSTVYPNGWGGGGDIHVHATLVLPDGQILAKQTIKAARQKQSIR